MGSNEGQDDTAFKNNAFLHWPENMVVKVVAYDMVKVMMALLMNIMLSNIRPRTCSRTQHTTGFKVVMALLMNNTYHAEQD